MILSKMNLANKVTLARILLVPVFILALVIKITYQNILVGNYVATIVFIIAASTDGIDGYIARKRKQVTTFGQFLDPLADKLLITAALTWLVERGEISSWIATIIIGREFIITGVRLVAAKEGIVIEASLWGKLKTITQIVAIILSLIADLVPFKPFMDAYALHKIAMTIAVIITVYSGYDYIKKNLSFLKSGDY